MKVSDYIYFEFLPTRQTYMLMDTLCIVKCIIAKHVISETFSSCVVESVLCIDESLNIHIKGWKSV